MMEPSFCSHSRKQHDVPQQQQQQERLLDAIVQKMLDRYWMFRAQLYRSYDLSKKKDIERKGRMLLHIREKNGSSILSTLIRAVCLAKPLLSSSLFFCPIYTRLCNEKGQLLCSRVTRFNKRRTRLQSNAHNTCEIPAVVDRGQHRIDMDPWHCGRKKIYLIINPRMMLGPGLASENLGISPSGNIQLWIFK